MIKILFLCHGNICRSTMAQYVLQDMVNNQGIADRFYIDSQPQVMKRLATEFIREQEIN